MYVPAHFKPDDDAVRELLHKHGAADLITFTSKGLLATMLPTWNYITAHVYGEVIVHDDPTWVADNVERLTAKYEATRVPAWSVADAPASFIEGPLRAIVGVELRISRIEAKFKLSQNGSEQDMAGVVRGLASDGQRLPAPDTADFWPTGHGARSDLASRK